MKGSQGSPSDLQNYQIMAEELLAQAGLEGTTEDGIFNDGEHGTNNGC